MLPMILKIILFGATGMIGQGVLRPGISSAGMNEVNAVAAMS